jgi:hypothetical protein
LFSLEKKAFVLVARPFFSYHQVAKLHQKKKKTIDYKIQRTKGENTLKVNHFCSKKVMYNKYYSMQ